jgi:hypothetical protein
MREVEQGKVPDPGAAFLDFFLAEMRAEAIRRAADGNQGALTYLFRDLMREVEQGKVPDPGAARVMAHVLKRFLDDGEDIEKILGTQARRGRPCEYKSAIKVHATVRAFMLDSQRSGRTQRRGDDAQAAAAEALGMSPDTVRENYKRVSKLIKKPKEGPFFDLGRVGVSPIEEAYLIDPKPENAVFLLDWMSRNPTPQIEQVVKRLHIPIGR